MDVLEWLEELQKVSLETVDPDELVDIRDVTIDTSLPIQERIIDFISQIKNPYCFKCGKGIVKVSFSDAEVTLEQRMEAYLRSLL